MSDGRHRGPAKKEISGNFFDEEGWVKDEHADLFKTPHINELLDDSRESRRDARQSADPSVYNRRVSGRRPESEAASEQLKPSAAEDERAFRAKLATAMRFLNPKDRAIIEAALTEKRSTQLGSGQGINN